MDANVCQHCGHDFRAPAPVAEKKTALPVIGGALILVAAIIGLIMGSVMIAIDAEDLDQWGVDVAGVTDIVEDILTVCGAITIVLGLIAALGGVFGIMRKHWGLAIVGGVLGLFLVSPWLLASLLSLVGLILVAVSRKEFD